MLSIVRKNIEGKTVGIILPFHKLFCFSCPEYHEQFCSLHPHRDIVYRRVTAMFNGIKELHYKEARERLGLLSLERRRLMRHHD